MTRPKDPESAEKETRLQQAVAAYKKRQKMSRKMSLRHVAKDFMPRNAEVLMKYAPNAVSITQPLNVTVKPINAQAAKESIQLGIKTASTESMQSKI